MTSKVKKVRFNLSKCLMSKKWTLKGSSAKENDEGKRFSVSLHSFIWLNSPFCYCCNSRGQFHQHFTSSICMRKSRKRKKDSQVKQLFAVLRSVCVKLRVNTLMKLTPAVKHRCLFSFSLPNVLQIGLQTIISTIFTFSNVFSFNLSNKRSNYISFLCDQNDVVKASMQ